MKKSNFHDYAVAAFGFYAKEGGAEAYERRIYEEALFTGRALEHGAGGRRGSPSEGAFTNLVGGATVPVEKGGTGSASRTAAFANLVSGSVVGLANGGTGAATAPAAREALGFSYGSAAPSGTPAGGAGAVYFKV